MIAATTACNRRTLAIVLAALLVAGTAVVLHDALFRPTTITAYFTSATSIYPGDEVRVAGGVKVGTIESIEPQGAQAKLTLAVDHGVPIPADAKAVIMAQNLVAAATCSWHRPTRTAGRPWPTVHASVSNAPRCPSSGIRSRTS